VGVDVARLVEQAVKASRVLEQGLRPGLRGFLGGDSGERAGAHLLEWAPQFSGDISAFSIARSDATLRSKDSRTSLSLAVRPIQKFVK
jgi:hypothetical protein